MSANPTCSIIIPVLNLWRHTEQCIRAICRNTPGVDFEIIVIDNGSEDETLPGLRKLATEVPQLRFERNDRNLGYSVANNQGANSAQGECLIFLNNDTIVRAGWLNPLVSNLGQGVGLCGPKLTYPFTHNINHAGYVYNSSIAKFYPIYHNFAAAHPAVNKKRPYQALLGACFVMYKADFQSIGGFRDFGLEDVDLCLRVRELGKQVVYVPESEVVHYGSLTLNRSAPELIAKATNQQFNTHWPPDKLSADDQQFYEQDGFSFGINSQGEFLLERRDAPFYALLAQAQDLIHTSNFEAARELLEQASLVESGSKELIIQSVSLELGLGNLVGAKERLLKLVALDPLHLEAYTMAAQLDFQIGNTAEAHKILSELMSLSDLPFETAEEVSAVLNNKSPISA